MNRTHIGSRYPDRTRARHCESPARWRRPTRSPSRLSSAVFWGAQRPPESRVWACRPSFPVAFCTTMMDGGEQWEKNNGFVYLPLLLPINVRADASVSIRKVFFSSAVISENVTFWTLHKYSPIVRDDPFDGLPSTRIPYLNT